MNRLFWFVLAATLVGFSGCQRQEKDTPKQAVIENPQAEEKDPPKPDGFNEAVIKKELENLEGTWQYESMQVGGDPPFGGIEQIAKMTLAIKGDIYTIKSQDKVLGLMVLKIDPGKSPKTIDLTVSDGPDKGKTVPGIYHLEEDSLKICVSNTGYKRPTEFSSNSVIGHILITFKRVKS